MQLGVHVVQFTFPGEPASIGPTLARTGQAVEDAGIAHLSVMDHYFQMEAMFPATEPMLEGYVTLGYLAAHTSTARLGLLVTGVTYRHPGLLAKIVATLDVLSGGRGELGIGAAWYDREHAGLGVPFPSTAERFERLTEALQICRQMWSDDNGPYQGKHYQLAETMCIPAPLSRPRLPILIGGGGERKTLRLVAQYADACNLFATTPAEIVHKLDVLRRHCDDVGRDYAEISKTVLYRGPGLEPGGADAFLTGVEPYAKLGIDTVIVVPPGGADPAVWIEQVCAPITLELAGIG
jgi:F420-dependent oxidoreductase-like protein